VSTFFVTGSNGFVGSALCNRLLSQGHRVRGLVQPSFPGYPVTGLEILEGSLEDCEVLKRGAEGADAVIHLAARAHVLKETETDPLIAFRAVNVEGTRRLAELAAKAGVRRFVLMSSIGVNGESSAPGAAFSEKDPPRPESPYAISKREAEVAIRQISSSTGLEFTFLRPPLVYGPRCPGNFLRLLKLVKLGLPLPFASVSNRRSLIYVENLVDAISSCALSPAAANQLFLVSDGEDLSTAELMRRLARLMEVPSRLLPFPAAPILAAGKLPGLRALDKLLGSLEVNSARIRETLGWRPPYSLEQGLSATAQWYEVTAIP